MKKPSNRVSGGGGFLNPHITRNKVLRYDVKKSWKRDKLLQILLDQDQAFKAAFIEKNKPAKFAPEEKVRLEKQLEIATKRKKAIQLLFFV